MKILTGTLALIVASMLFLSSCSQKRYREDIGCGSVCDVAADMLGGRGIYSEYTEEYIRYELGDRVCDADDRCVIYSTATEDINELGIFFVSDDDELREVAKACREYIEYIRESKRAFISSYAPLELSKLDDARVMVFGNYVVYCILDERTADMICDEIEKILALV